MVSGAGLGVWASAGPATNASARAAAAAILRSGEVMARP